MLKAFNRTNNLPLSLTLMILRAVIIGIPLALLIIWVCS
jgi:hypothetical protein